jgi:hypothetical protein
MRNEYYSDKRDLIKWSVLLFLARKQKADRILQIAYFNTSKYGDIEIDGQRFQPPAEVISHFRSIGNIVTLSVRPRISVFDTPFADRKTYHRAALDFIAAFQDERCVVFLDPDIGLEPKNPDARHVLNGEVRKIWNKLPAKWTLVFYQHETNKAGKPWIEDKRRQLANAIAVEIDAIGVASGTKIAKDVVFFHLTKD